MNFEEFKEQYQKVPVELYPHEVNEKPVVSVCVMTYQHANCIKDCLDGILMQKTDFSFEILLGEDASTDGTREICIEYAKKYPEKIRLFLHRRENNIQYFGNASGKFNFVYNLFNAKGQYIALCEGDDYWTDPNKLQKQIDILEKNKSLVMCTHETNHIFFPVDRNRSWRRAASIFFWDIQLYGLSRFFSLAFDLLFKNNNFWLQERSHLNQKRKQIIHLKDMTNGKWFMSLCSIVMRRSIVDPLPVCYVENNGGHQLTLLLGAMKGGIFHLKIKMGTKRDQKTSISKNKERIAKIKVQNSILETSNRVKRYNCLKLYASIEQEKLLDIMLEGYKAKYNKK